MGRKRKNNTHLPRHVYVHGQSYRYRPPGSPGVRLAPISDYSGMLRALADLNETPPQYATMRALIDQYEAVVTPTKSKANHKAERAYLERLRKGFGKMPPRNFRAHHLASLRDKIGKGANGKPRTANIYVELVSHLFSMGGEWGAVDQHPTKGLVKKIPIKARRRLPTDDEFTAVRDLAPPMVACVMDIALLTGLRRKDILELTRDDVTGDGLYCHTSKTDVALLFEWTDELRQAIDAAMRQTPRVRRPVICNRFGKAYTPRGFGAVWGKLMRAYVESGGERFQFRDIRRKSASDDADAKRAANAWGTRRRR